MFLCLDLFTLNFSYDSLAHVTKAYLTLLEVISNPERSSYLYPSVGNPSDLKVHLLQRLLFLFPLTSLFFRVWSNRCTLTCSTTYRSTIVPSLWTFFWTNWTLSAELCMAWKRPKKVVKLRHKRYFYIVLTFPFLIISNNYAQ